MPEHTMIIVEFNWLARVCRVTNVKWGFPAEVREAKLSDDLRGLFLISPRRPDGSENGRRKTTVCRKYAREADGDVGDH